LDAAFDAGRISFVNKSLNSSILSVVDTMMTGRAPRGVVNRFLLVDDPDSVDGLGRGGTSPEDDGEEIKDVRDEEARESRGKSVFDWELEKWAANLEVNEGVDSLLDDAICAESEGKEGRLNQKRNR
jgi:hypothetical protein